MENGTAVAQDFPWTLASAPKVVRNLSHLDEPVIVLTGARSGSTLVRQLLDAHPDLACPPETNLLSTCAQIQSLWSLMDPACQGGALSPLASASIKAVIDTIFGTYLLRRGKRRWCEKSLGSVHSAEAFLGLYPKTKFICLYRHCIDMVDSALEATPWGLNGYGFDAFVARFPGNSIAAVAGYWCELTKSQLEFEEANQDKCLRVYYEELVSNPDQVCGEIFSFIGVDNVPDIVRSCFDAEPDVSGPGDHKITGTSQITTASLGRGARIPVSRIPPGHLQVVNDLLARLGYAVLDDAWSQSVCPPKVLPSRTVPTTDDTADAGTADVVLAKVDEMMRARLTAVLVLPEGIPPEDSPSPGLADLRVGFVAYCGTSGQRAIYWEPAGSNGQIRSGSYTEQEELHADWLLTADAATWAAVLSGKDNLAACIRSRDVRYISLLSDEEEEQRGIIPEMMNARIASVAYRLRRGGRPPHESQRTAENDLEAVRS